MTRVTDDGVSDEFLSQMEEFANQLMDGVVVHGHAERGIRGAMVSVMARELRSLRAQALTDEEREALTCARDVLDNDTSGHDVTRAVAVLIRLIATHSDKEQV